MIMWIAINMRIIWVYLLVIQSQNDNQTDRDDNDDHNGNCNDESGTCDDGNGKNSSSDDSKNNVDIYMRQSKKHF